ncbi:MAG: ADP-glyceromanno-heptose 6-epimerase [Chlorobi bacterium]|nr:ADP-glyceromanno-heptose 6-epimerase [Chlorobiota bacterium]
MIVVTGGAGFIGSNLVKMLNEQGIDNIIIVDNLGSSLKFLNLNKLRFKDFIDKNTFLDKIDKLGKTDLILHQGACSSTTQTDVNYLMKNNYEYSKTLLHYCIDNETDFIYASSASVYGNGDNGFMENPECEYPLNGYAFSKFIFDNYVRKVYSPEKYKSQVTGLRYFNVYGYQENHKGSMASVPFHFFNQAKETGEIKVFEGSENFLRDFIFVEDVARVVNFFIESGKSGIYNCGTGQERSFMDMAEIFVNLYGNCKINTIPFPDHLKGKYQAFTKADVTNLRKAGFNGEFTSLEKGMEKYLKRLKENNGYF